MFSSFLLFSLAKKLSLCYNEGNDYRKEDFTMYRQEHPKPQFERADWQNLNGQWQFEIDHAASGKAKGWQAPEKEFSMRIEVPFCPESKLSGIGHTDFMRAVWYKRNITVTKAQLSGIVRLHFGAVDYDTTVYVNGKQCGTHRGGYVSFFFDITPYLQEGENVITVCAEDDTRDPLIPSGKQSMRYESHGCFYTRTTGIWQTVWLEYLPQAHIEHVQYYPSPESVSLGITASVVGKGTLTVKAFYEGREVGSAETVCESGTVALTLPLSEKHLWEVGKGRLYDLELTFREDRVKSYFGLRDVRMDGYKFLLNGKSVFQRLVLDQGFYPDGIYTAPSDEALRADVERSLAVGFNGARPHEKVFEERFFYHCDKLGYLVWGEYPNWGLEDGLTASAYPLLCEWIEELKRDFNHPSIIGWCPYNETSVQRYRPGIRTVYRTTKALDPTRPCIDTSGYFHVETDIYDVHDYDQNPESFKKRYDQILNYGEYHDRHSHNQPYPIGMPFFVSEYGGIRWTADQSGWGYGEAPRTEEEFLTRLKGLTDALLQNPCILGYCYTQLTDVEQEQNGIYTYDRREKFPAEQLYPIFAGKAAIEE